MKVCCGGILGMGESQQDRGSMLAVLANMEFQPESVPINMLVPIPGTPLAQAQKVEPIDFVRTVAVARIMLPKSVLRVVCRSQINVGRTPGTLFFRWSKFHFLSEIGY